MASVVFGGSFFMKGSNAKGGIVTFSAPGGIVAMGANIDRKVTPNVPDASPADVETLMQIAQDAASHEIAKKAARRMRSFFNPKNAKFYVGIGSKDTPRGIVVPTTPQGSPGSVLYVIRERRRSLRLIRQGLPKGAKGPHSKRFLRWLDEQEIEDRGDNRKTAEAERESTMFRIATHVKQHGLSQHWANDIDVTGGKPFFNYPQYYNTDYASADAESVIRWLAKGDAKTGLKVGITSVAMGVLSSARFLTSGKQKVNIRNYAKGSRGRIPKAKLAKITVKQVREEENVSARGGTTAIESGTWTLEERKRRARELAAKYNKKK